VQNWHTVLRNDMHAIEHTYVSLLADVALLSGFSEIRGSYEGLQWCLNEAPKLEKKILAAIEEGEELSLDSFPEWLKRLAAASVKDAYKLRLIRQLLLFCYKAYVTHDKTTTEKAFEGFLQTNEEVRKFGNSFAIASPKLLDQTRRHVQSVLYKLDASAIKPSHGPGAVTTSKETWTKRYDTIEYLYPQSDWFGLYFNPDHAAELADAVHDDTIEAKVIAVPKDSRGPRLICVHPAEAIWLQQGIRRVLERSISRPRSSQGPWPKGHVHFDDQAVNGKIALLSSSSRRYATIDMKEASDRISDLLVQILFGRKYKHFGCCRAQRFLIPRLGNMLNLRGQIHSYAPMGNATTFPVQSLVFWAICVSSLQRHGFHQPGAVFVFGDDIILPSECAEFVINDLESFGLLVNRTKSFWRGAFRESCGVDAFNGVNVTPVRWKTTVDAKHLTGLQSLSDIALRLRRAGYEEAAATSYGILRTRLRRLGKDLFFTNDPDHGGLAEFTTSDYLAFRDSYWNRDTQWFTSPIHRLEPVRRNGGHDHWNGILESILSLERMGSGEIPPRTPSRGYRLNRGWTHVR
jgi:hypothetical protein